MCSADICFFPVRSASGPVPPVGYTNV